MGNQKKDVVTKQISTYFPAHCIVGAHPDDITILHSSSILYPDEITTEIQVVELIVHEEYNASNSFINDIGLMRLATPIESTFVDFRAKLSMRGQYTPTGTLATVVGWGRNEVKFQLNLVAFN